MKRFTLEEINKIKELILSGSLENIKLAHEILSSEEGAYDSLVKQMFGKLLDCIDYEHPIEDIHCLLNSKDFVPYYEYVPSHTEVPKEIGLLTQITFFSYSQKGITTLPESLANCDKLERVAIHVNYFTEIPIVLARLPKLKSLCLANNREVINFSSLPKLKSLIKLDIDGNKLNTVPIEIKELTNLEELHLTNNNLTKLPDWLTDLPNLKKILTYGNDLDLEETFRFEKLMKQKNPKCLTYLG